MKTLFLGGQEDGEWRDVESGRRYLEISEVVEMPALAPCESKPEMETYRVFKYDREFLRGKDGEEYSVMMLSGSEDCLIDKLIKGYRKAP